MRAARVAVASMLAGQLLWPGPARADDRGDASALAERLASTVVQADAAVVAACGSGWYPTRFPECLQAVVIEHRTLLSEQNDVRRISSSASANTSEAGLKAGLQQRFA